LLYIIKKNIFFIVIAFIILIISLFIFNNQSTQQMNSIVEVEPAVIPKSQDDNPEEDTEVQFKVDIKGEVNNPGVYEVKSDYRVIDVIQIAGGLTQVADESKINLAQKVTDEMVIVVPKEGEDEANITVNFSNEQEDGKINLNQASVEEIITLNGIGPKKAQAIVDYREENGPFQQVEDLLQVNGIGEKTLENVRDDITVP